MTPLLPWLVIAAVLLLVTEIAGRRLSLWERLAPISDEIPAPSATPKPKRRWPTIPKRSKPAVTSAPHTVAASVPAPTRPAEPTVADVFAQAKQRARK